MDALAPVKVTTTPDGRQWVSLSDYLVLIDTLSCFEFDLARDIREFSKVLDAKVRIADADPS